MKSNISSLAYLSALYAMGVNNGNSGGGYVEPKETEQERKVRMSKAEIDRYKAQGLKEFFYGSNSLWALNQKSADKKAKKLNWLEKGNEIGE